jgi:hypothetical protein
MNHQPLASDWVFTVVPLLPSVFNGEANGQRIHAL